MIVFSIFIITLTVTFLSFRLFRIAAGSMSLLKLNTVSYVFYFQVVTSSVVGSMLLAMGKLDYHHYTRYISDSVKFEAWLWVLYALLMMPVAMLVLNHLFKIKARQLFVSYIKQPVQLLYRKGYLNLLSVLLLLYSIGLISYILYYTEHIPLFTLLAGNAKEAAKQRIEVRYHFLGNEYVKNLLGLMLIPVLSYYQFVVAYIKRNWLHIIAFAGMFLAACFLMVYDIQKAPVAFYLFGYLIIFTLIKGGVTRKQFFVIFIVPIVLILVAYQLTTGYSALRLFYEFDSAFYGRIFLTGYFAFPLSLELFPDVITEPTYYSGIPHFILDYFGIDNIESARRLMMYINPEGVKNGTANLFSGYYLAEAWANYGYAGLLLSPIIVGAIIQFVHIYLLKHLKSPLLIAFYSYITIKWLLTTGVVNFVFLKIILYPFILYLLIKYLFDKGNIFYRKLAS